MNLNFDGSKLILIDEKSELKINNLSQLKSWGFEYSITTRNKHEAYYSDDLLGKTAKYLNKRGFEIKLDPYIKERLDKWQSEKEGISKKYELLREYKNGNITDKLKIGFEEHKSFLKTLPRLLKDHQVKASFHLYLAENSANFSVPGSGKTSVVLSVYERLRQLGEVNSLFVIGPLSSFGSWKIEFEKTLGRKANSYILAGGVKKVRMSEYYNYSDPSELYLTSFQTVMFDFKHVIKLLRHIKAFLVVDEAHYIKKVGGVWSDAVLSLSKYARKKVVLTGTPMPQGYYDLYNLLDFLYPEIQFLSNKDKHNLKTYQEYGDVESAKNLLEKNVSGLFYRVRKSELGLQSQLLHDPIVIKMREMERLVYDAIKTKIVSFNDKDFLNNIEFVKKLYKGRMMRLRQAVSYTKLISTSIDDYEEDILKDEIDLRRIINNYDRYEVPNKIDELIKIVNKLLSESQKVIIWSNFLGTITLIENHLNKIGILSKKIIGATPVENETEEIIDTRESIRNEFIDPSSKLRVLLANPAACAESISLHISCSNAVYYDLSYNCAQYLQSLDRIHRVGGSETKEANYYFLQYENSIDEDIHRSLIRKAERMGVIIDDDYEIYNLDMFDPSDEIEAYKRLFKG